MVTPAHPMRFAQCHDSEAYSDPSEGVDVDGPDNCPACGLAIKESDKENLIEQASEQEQCREED